MIAIAASTQLFVYSWFGTIVTDEGRKVSLTIYASEWYTRSYKHRYYYRIILLRSQKLTVFNGMDFFDCSMNCFTTVGLQIDVVF